MQQRQHSPTQLAIPGDQYRPDARVIDRLTPGVGYVILRRLWELLTPIPASLNDPPLNPSSL